MNNRLKLTLILLTLLFIGVAAKADVPRHVAITQQQATIDSPQHQLTIAQSEPYNQGYQQGYKVANIERNKKDWEPIIILVVIIILVGLSSLIIPKHWIK